VTATGIGALMEARGALVAAMQDDPLAATRNSICDSHADYIWDIGM